MINVSSIYEKYFDCKGYHFFFTFSTKLHDFMDLVVRELLTCYV